ncbi:MAG: DUF932 domain-containing protein [archaeon]
MYTAKKERLGDLIKTVEKMEGEKVDKRIPVDRIRMDDDGLLNIDGRKHELTDHALTQLVSKVRSMAGLSASIMKVGYLKACPPHSRAYQINDWIENYLKKEKNTPEWLIRFNNERVRGILSKNYSIFDNKELLNILREVKGDSIKFENIWVDQNQVHLRSIKEDTKLGRNKDALMAGWHISNDEVGKRSIRVDFLIYQLICTNGLMGIKEHDALFKRRHYGVDEEKIKHGFAAALDLNHDKALETIDLFMETKNKEIDSDDLELIFSAVRNSHPIISKEITERAKNEVDNYLINNKLTKFTLISSLTTAARDLLVGENRYDVERAAGKLLDKKKIYTPDKEPILLESDAEVDFDDLEPIN